MEREETEGEKTERQRETLRQKKQERMKERARSRQTDIQKVKKGQILSTKSPAYFALHIQMHTLLMLVSCFFTSCHMVAKLAFGLVILVVAGSLVLLQLVLGCE